MQLENISVPPIQLQLGWENNIVNYTHICICKQEKQQSIFSPLSRVLIDRLQDYVSGKPVSWPVLPLNWGQVPDFSRQILSYIYSELTWGKWLSYSHLAELCNHPRAARAIGMVMSRNPWPLLVPCHRVLGKGKRLGGFSSGLKLKQLLLNFEDIL